MSLINAREAKTAWLFSTSAINPAIFIVSLTSKGSVAVCAAILQD